MRYILFLVIIVFSAVSCNDWLDVRPDTEQKDEDQFSSVKGFFDALTGCYMSLANNDVYGERLTMTNIESLANLWNMPEDNTRYEDKDLTKHDYTTDYSKSAIKAVYGGLFYVIAQANMIIKNADVREHVFTDESIRAVVQGEAYALRAYCQLDVLRLFGQLPRGASLQVSLPYSETTSIYEMPTYYDFDSYVVKLKDDLEKAEGLLKENDPVFAYTFKELNGNADVNNDHLLYRQSRLNYWAVRALRARMHLYLGETADAYRVAKELIEATGPGGDRVIAMSGSEDFKAGYKLCPSECLFYLSKYDVMAYSTVFLIGGEAQTQYGTSHLAITQGMLTNLYEGENIASHNRYVNCWNKRVQDRFGQLAYVAVSKYYFSEDVKNKMLYYQLIPMLRMSEVYLIAMETSGNLPEVNGWYKDYMLAHDVPNSVDFTSLDAAREYMVKEYRREFFAEGQMFYTYKRTGTTTMLWRSEAVTESEYVLPLPQTEYNPNNLSK